MTQDRGVKNLEEIFKIADAIGTFGYKCSEYMIGGPPQHLMSFDKLRQYMIIKQGKSYAESFLDAQVAGGTVLDYAQPIMSVVEAMEREFPNLAPLEVKFFIDLYIRLDNIRVMIWRYQHDTSS